MVINITRTQMNPDPTGFRSGSTSLIQRVPVTHCNVLYIYVGRTLYIVQCRGYNSVYLVVCLWVQRQQDQHLGVQRPLGPRFQLQQLDTVIQGLHSRQSGRETASYLVSEGINEWICSLLNERISELMNKKIKEWRGEFMNEWVSDWVSGWMIEWLSD